jgi:hypothetical protein
MTDDKIALRDLLENGSGSPGSACQQPRRLPADAHSVGQPQRKGGRDHPTSSKSRWFPAPATKK